MPLLRLLAACLTAVLASAAPRGPNVIVILSDDQGSADLGCYGSKDLRTPHLDALAARGVRFTRFYSAAPVCSPSRAGLLTGQWPVRAGVPNNCSSERGGAGALPPESFTMAEMFKAAGYATAHLGKWHIGYTDETMPLAQGFDHSFGHMGGCIDNYSHFFYWQGPNRHDLWRDGREVRADGRYFPDLLAEEAETFIERNRARPFFIYLAFNAPHYPYQGEPAALERFAALPTPRREYAAFLESMDARLGRIFAKLEALGLRDDTVVVFQSDNGHSTEERAHFGGGSAGGLRGAKFSLTEGGIRVPAIVSWPGKIAQGVSRDALGHACDWLPTLAELAGLPAPRNRIDGRSLAPLLRPDAKDDLGPRTLHWQVGTGPNAEWAVLDGEWKLVGRGRDTADGRKVVQLRSFLVNLKEDPAETRDRSAERPDLVERLQRLHRDHLN